MSNLESTRTSPVENTSTPASAAAGCCGGPAPKGADACCVRDAEVKATGGSGCGCGTTTATTATPAPTRSVCC